MFSQANKNMIKAHDTTDDVTIMIHDTILSNMSPTYCNICMRNTTRYGLGANAGKNFGGSGRGLKNVHKYHTINLIGRVIYLFFPNISEGI
jgi:hypothetical protein